MKITTKVIIACGLLGTAVSMLSVRVVTAQPQWWSTANVINTNALPNDFAAVNQGQLKWMASKASEHMEANLVGGSGDKIHAFVDSLSLHSDYVPVNHGQLKAVSSIFYDRLIEEGYAASYPWDNGPDANDYAMVNIGMVKNLFDFDLRDEDGDGLQNGIETGSGIFVSPAEPGTDPCKADSDADGVSDSNEIAARTDPNSDDRIPPSITILAPASDSRAEGVW